MYIYSDRQTDRQTEREGGREEEGRGSLQAFSLGITASYSQSRSSDASLRCLNKAPGSGSSIVRPCSRRLVLAGLQSGTGSYPEKATPIQPKIAGTLPCIRQEVLGKGLLPDQRGQVKGIVQELPCRFYLGPSTPCLRVLVPKAIPAISCYGFGSQRLQIWNLWILQAFVRVMAILPEVAPSVYVRVCVPGAYLTSLLLGTTIN